MGIPTGFFVIACAPYGLYSTTLFKRLLSLGNSTNVNEHPINTEWGPGLWEAVETFLVKDSEFARDPGREKFLMTYNPGGYLRRAATASSNEIDNKDAIEVQS